LLPLWQLLPMLLINGDIMLNPEQEKLVKKLEDFYVNETYEEKVARYKRLGDEIRKALEYERKHAPVEINLSTGQIR